MNKLLLSLLLALLLGSLPALAEQILPPQDIEQIEALQRRADKLAFSEPGANNYHLAKARAWLDLALDEYYGKDTSGIVQAAVAQAEALLDALDKKQAGLTMDTPAQLPGSEPVRPDLWDRVAALKGNAKFSCGQRKLAEAEVQLVWTGHQKTEYGWSHAQSYARGAEDMIYEAQAAIDNCNKQAAAEAQPVAAAAPQTVAATQPAPVTVVVEKYVLSADTLFAFGSSELIRGASLRLDKLAETIKGWSAIEDITLVGHTDHFGTAAYNQKLSEERAERIKQYLAGKGILPGALHASGAGAAQPLTACSPRLPRQEQISCLQPNRRVEITLYGIK